MVEVIKQLKVNDEVTYPLAYTLNVMQIIQEEYGTINKWGELTESGKDGETDVKALKFGFMAMLNEGIDINNEDNGTNEPYLTPKQVGRILSGVGAAQVTEDINNVVIESVKSDEKNV